MEINKALFARYAELERAEEKALKDRDTGTYRQVSVALLEIINELAESDLEFKTIDGTLCLVTKTQEQQFYHHRLQRNYQFPNAVKTITEGDTVGWVVNEILKWPLYGVVRYTVDGDRVAWIESDAHFGSDVEAAERWIRETIAGLKQSRETTN